MRNQSLFGRLARAARITAALATAALIAAPQISRAAPRFDTPAKVVTIPANGDQDAITCTFYADIIVRIAGTDTPAPENASLLQRPAAPAAFACAGQPSGGVTLPTEGFDLSGRKGNFLIFEATDPSGASALIIFDARSGRKLFADGESAITSVEDTQGTLQMRYIRAINGTCSLLTDRNGCWAALLGSGQIPRGVFPGPPALATCAKTYRQAEPPTVPNDDPSLVSYPAALTLDSAGHASLRSSGPIGCDPMP
jgi:hypothetical protein